MERFCGFLRRLDPLSLNKSVRGRDMLAAKVATCHWPNTSPDQIHSITAQRISLGHEGCSLARQTLGRPCWMRAPKTHTDCQRTRQTGASYPAALAAPSAAPRAPISAGAAKSDPRARHNPLCPIRNSKMLLVELL